LSAWRSAPAWSLAGGLADRIEGSKEVGEMLHRSRRHNVPLVVDFAILGVLSR
jgi:hypothetical protein